jgi:hypothetical protein
MYIYYMGFLCIYTSLRKYYLFFMCINYYVYIYKFICKYIRFN